MQYKEKILELIFDADENAFINWVKEQPLIDQPDILREYQQVCIEMIEERGEEVPKEIFASLENKTNKFEEAILDEQVASLKYDIAQKECDKAMDELVDAYENIIEEIKNGIISNTDNKEALIDIAKYIIEVEKENNLYDAENWYWLNDFL